MADRIVCMGAGGLALGFLGPELRKDHDLTFLDVSSKADLVEGIQRTGAYTTNVAGERIEARTIEDVDAFLIDDPAQDAAIRDRIAGSRMFFTAVGIRNFDSAVAYLAERIEGRKDDVYILCAENGEGVTDAWRRRTPENVHFLDTVMGRMCRLEERAAPDYAPVVEGLDWGVVGEAFFGMPLSDQYLNAEVFHSEAFQFVSDDEFHARDRVKLYAHNGLHCFIAIQGRLRKVERFSDMAGDPEVEDAARALLDEEIAAALWKECGPHLHRAYLQDYFERLPGRLLSPTLRDQVARGVRGLALKFSPNERIIGGLDLLLRNSVRPNRFLDFIAGALAVIRADEGEEAAASALANIKDKGVRDEVERRAASLTLGSGGCL